MGIFNFVAVLTNVTGSDALSKALASIDLGKLQSKHQTLD